MSPHRIARGMCRSFRGEQNREAVATARFSVRRAAAAASGGNRIERRKGIRLRMAMRGQAAASGGNRIERRLGLRVVVILANLPQLPGGTESRGGRSASTSGPSVSGRSFRGEQNREAEKCGEFFDDRVHGRSFRGEQNREAAHGTRGMSDEASRRSFRGEQNREADLPRRCNGTAPFRRSFRGEQNREADICGHDAGDGRLAAASGGNRIERRGKLLPELRAPWEI